jgi:hypothetical protein
VRATRHNYARMIPDKIDIATPINDLLQLLVAACYIGFAIFLAWFIDRVLGISWKELLSILRKEILGLIKGDWNPATINALTLFGGLFVMILFFCAPAIEDNFLHVFYSSQNVEPKNGPVIKLIMFIMYLFMGVMSALAVRESSGQD